MQNQKELHEMSKMEIVQLICKEYGGQTSSYYNTSTNQQRNSFWTWNRTFRHYLDLKENFVYDKETGTRSRVKLNGKPY